MYEGTRDLELVLHLPVDELDDLCAEAGVLGLVTRDDVETGPGDKVAPALSEPHVRRRAGVELRDGTEGSRVQDRVLGGKTRVSRGTIRRRQGVRTRKSLMSPGLWRWSSVLMLPGLSETDTMPSPLSFSAQCCATMTFPSLLWPYRPMPPGPSLPPSVWSSRSTPPLVANMCALEDVETMRTAAGGDTAAVETRTGRSASVNA